MSGMYENVEASLLKFCNDQIMKNGLTFKPFNFDTHATINEIPAGQYIGIGELGMVNAQETYEASCQFVVVTDAQDVTLKELRKAINIMFTALKPGTIISIVDAESAAHVGHLKVEAPVRILAVGASKGRPIQTIAVQFGSTLLVPP